MALHDNFCAGIRRRRLELGLKQSEVAELMGVSRPMVAQAETGVHRPNLETVEKFAKALNVPPLYLLMEPVASEDKAVA